MSATVTTHPDATSRTDHTRRTGTPARHRGPSPRTSRAGHRVARSTPPTRGSAPGLDELAARLTTRDRWILRMLAEHRVLTTTHLHTLCFPSARATQYRLRDLHALRVVDAFRPMTTRGSLPLHWVLAPTGALVLAAEDGIDPPTGRSRSGGRDQHLAVAHSHQLRHLIGTNTVLTHLATDHHTRTNNGMTNAMNNGQAHAGDRASGRTEDRARDGARLRVWWSATRCTHTVGDHIQPDAYLRWSTNPTPATGAGFGCWFEYDTGTETTGQVTAKLPGYHELAATTATSIPILIWLPTARRELTIRAALATTAATLTDPDAPLIATTSPQPPTQRQQWWPLHPHRGGVADGPPHRCDITTLARHWPHRTDPAHAESIVLTSNHHPGPRNRQVPVRERARAWTNNLTPPDPCPPPPNAPPTRR